MSAYFWGNGPDPEPDPERPLGRVLTILLAAALFGAIMLVGGYHQAVVDMRPALVMRR